MIDDTGIFRTTFEIAAYHSDSSRTVLHDVVVDTGSQFSWIPSDMLREIGVTPERHERFESSDGRIFERAVGYALIFAAGRAAPTMVTFAHPGDNVRLGAIALRGLNLRIDRDRKELVPAGPVLVGVAA